MSPLIILPLSAWAAAAAPAWRPAGWIGLGPLLIDLLILDLLIYGWHRANHVLPWLWRFHEIHHLDQFLDATSALRFHFGEVLSDGSVGSSSPRQSNGCITMTGDRIQMLITPRF